MHTNSYTYENDRLKTVNHNGFDYTFNYDEFGNNTSVLVGNQNLITNVFEEYQGKATGRLEKSIYGNGQEMRYSYDDLDRVSAIRYSPDGISETERYKNEYDGSGNLGFHEDLVNGTSYRYYYDLSDRLAKIVEGNGDLTSFEFDKNNNTSKLVEQIAGNSYTTSYGYDKDNRPKSLRYSNGVDGLDYSYDSLGRLRSKDLISGSTQYQTRYNFLKGINDSSTSKVQSISNNGELISYSYDNNGNISVIKEEGKRTNYYYDELNQLVREEVRTDNDLIAYYSFDKESIWDDSGNGYHGKTYGSPSFVDGINGKALEFNGIDQWAELGDFELPENFTISLWVNPYTTNDQQSFIGKEAIMPGLERVIIPVEIRLQATTN